jgi:hypothetical protein
MFTGSVYDVVTPWREDSEWFGGHNAGIGSDEEDVKERAVVLSAANLKAIARARLADAEALLKTGRFDGSAYLSVCQDVSSILR